MGSSIKWQVGILRTMMRAAIPVEDIGSRSAIQYAPEIVDFLNQYGIKLVTDHRYSVAAILSAIREMDEMDGQERAN